MTKPEFAQIMAYLGAGIQKQPPADTVEVYWDNLKDLPTEALQLAAKKVLNEHPWSTFPSIPELRQAAVDTMKGQVTELSAAEAWEIAWRAAGKIDMGIQGPYLVGKERCASQAEYAMKDLPPLIVASMRAFGLSSLVYGTEPVSVIRAQFLKIYDQLAGRERREALLPAPLRAAIANIGLMPEQRKQLTASK